MEKPVLMFPGVGSQYIGMGENYFNDFSIFKRTLEEASDTLGIDMSKLFFKEFGATSQVLSQLENAQLTVLTVSVGIFRVYMQEIGIEPHYCLGHSLGEYSALCCSGVIDFADALKLVRQRGITINEVSREIDGTMMWIINLEQKIVENVCNEVSNENDHVYISAYDCPTQTSISGHNEVIMKAAKQLQDLGAIVYPLKMSGPFHSPLMEKAAQQMKSTLNQFSYHDPLYPVIANRNAQLYQGKDSVSENLSLQLISPIRWQESITYLVEHGITTAIEIGPKDVLKFLMKKNSPDISPYTMDNQADRNTMQETFIIREEEYLPIIGKCLGIAVSTKNRNDDNVVYENEVIKPYRQIAQLYEELKSANRQPKREQVEESIKTLKSILDAKLVPQDEQNKRIGSLLKNRVFKPVVQSNAAALN